MKALARLRIVAPLVLSAAILLAPASARAATVAGDSATVVPSTQVAGVYRLTFSAKGQQARIMHLMLQQSGTGVEGLLLTDASDVLLTDARMEGDVLVAVVKTTAGQGTLRIDLASPDVHGTLTIGKHTLSVTGERAS